MFARLNRSASLASNLMVAAVLGSAGAAVASVRGGEVVVNLSTIETLTEQVGGQKNAGSTKERQGAIRPDESADSDEPGTPPAADEPITPCLADVTDDGLVTPDDMDVYLTAFFGMDEGAGISADVNRDGIISPDDLDDFITAYFSGCGGTIG
ncbi:MAG: GC-type dockerin domain-anchored protein [Phycisphaerales bacterium]